jgi:hypothetical protein
MAASLGYGDAHLRVQDHELLRALMYVCMYTFMFIYILYWEHPPSGMNDEHDDRHGETQHFFFV